MASSHKMGSRDRRRRKAVLFGPWSMCPCAFCGVRIAYDAAVLDHRRPAARGGHNGLGNLQLACKPCNDSRGSKPMVEFRRVLNLGECA